MSVVDDLEALGFRVTLEQEVIGREWPLDGVLILTRGAKRWQFNLKKRGRAPYPGELDGFREAGQKIAESGTPTLHAPYISDSLAKALSELGWSWIDELGNYDLRQDELVLRRRVAGTPPGSPVKRLFRSAASLTIARWLITQAELNKPLSQVFLKELCGISQPRVSQLLHSYEDHGLLTFEGRRGILKDRAALLSAFLAEYEGPGGSVQYGYSLDSPLEVAQKVMRWASETLNGDRRALISADVAADLLRAWRDPTHLMVYCGRSLPYDELGVVDAGGVGDANLIWRIPEDKSLFWIARAMPRSIKLREDVIRTVDIPQILWDLKDLGGSERLVALDELKAWHLKR